MDVVIRTPQIAAHAPVQRHALQGISGGGALDSHAFDITVAAGATVTHDVSLPPTGHVYGRVTERGEPVAGAWVFVYDQHDVSPRARNLDGIDADEPPLAEPVAVTDSDGRYGFRAFSAGTWPLYVRRPDTPLSSGPFVVTVGDPGVDVVQDMVLGGSRIAGTVDPDWRATWRVAVRGCCCSEPTASLRTRSTSRCAGCPSPRG